MAQIRLIDHTIRQHRRFKKDATILPLKELLIYPILTSKIGHHPQRDTAVILQPDRGHLVRLSA
jgi:hypothetical protein